MAAKWDISNCNDWKIKDGREKVIFNLHWNCTDSREYPNPEPEPEPDPGGWTPTLTAYGSIIGTCALDINDIQDFTPYDQVTKEMALGWLFSVMTVEQKAKSESYVEQQILNKIDPPTESGLPWS
tara:strand:+ start:208 stop:582 length:375 start_codon:yes stop_codon:yes gene_type:complete